MSVTQKWRVQSYLIRTIMKKYFCKSWTFLLQMNAKVLYISKLPGDLRSGLCENGRLPSFRLCFLNLLTLLQRRRRFGPPSRVDRAELKLLEGFGLCESTRLKSGEDCWIELKRKILDNRDWGQKPRALVLYFGYIRIGSCEGARLLVFPEFTISNSRIAQASGLAFKTGNAGSLSLTTKGVYIITSEGN